MLQKKRIHLYQSEDLVDSMTSTSTISHDTEADSVVLQTSAVSSVSDQTSADSHPSTDNNTVVSVSSDVGPTIQQDNNIDLPDALVQPCNIDMRNSLSSDEDNHMLNSVDPNKITHQIPRDATEQSTEVTTKDLPSKEAKKQICQIVLPSGNSLVQNMLEEAMLESLKDIDSRSSTTCSDLVRISSDINSGQTSGDEIETTTSSDIEILSLPSTSNGTDYGKDSRNSDRIDMSPVKHTLRGFRPGHYRSDSGSSILSGWSKNGDESLKFYSDDGGNSYALDVEKLLKKMAEMAEIIQAREKKLLEFSHENMDLQEINMTLKRELKQSEDNREMEISDLHSLKDEFSSKIAESKKNIQQLQQEKDDIYKQLKQKESQLMRKATSEAEIEELIAEKDQQIKELLEEGEKLSKQQLQNGNIIKKLRIKERENDSFIQNTQKKYDKLKNQLEESHQCLDIKMESEKKLDATITHLNKLVQKQEMQINHLKSDLEDSHEKVRSMQVALDGSYKEMTELHKARAAQASENQQAALSAEMQAKQELQIALDKVVSQQREQQLSYIAQIEDLQLNLGRQEKDYNRREDLLRDEIRSMQKRLQEEEMRNQELSQSVSGASRPLLRQIENLQSTYSAQTLTYEKMEKNLNDRLAEIQIQLATSVEKERNLSEECVTLQCTVAAMESQMSSLRQDKAKLSANLNAEKARADAFQENNDSEAAARELNNSIYEKTISELKKDKVVIENQLEMEKLKFESEHKKVTLAHEQLKEKEQQLQTQALNKSSPGTMSMNSSIASELNFMSISQHEELERSLTASALNGSRSLYDSLRQTGTLSSGNMASVMEGLQAQVKQRDGEMVQLQSDISDLEKTRERMSRELVNITMQNNQLQEQLDQHQHVVDLHKKLDARYQALLQMYGEKVEETNELKMDLSDMKELYKSQINELTKSMAL